jgi:AraC family transcriptional regulator of arabinose operon
MIRREETSAPVVAPIVTGYFREAPGYATWRTRGTSDFLLMLTLGGHGRVGWDGGQHITEAGDGRRRASGI